VDPAGHGLAVDERASGRLLAKVFEEHLQTVVKERDGWKDLYRACRDVV
jgi:hypothetical protein